MCVSDSDMQNAQISYHQHKVQHNLFDFEQQKADSSLVFFGEIAQMQYSLPHHRQQLCRKFNFYILIVLIVENARSTKLA